MSKLNTDLYYAAQTADEAYSAAIKAQFGPAATRWNTTADDWNMATHQAYRNKVVADEAWLHEMRRNAAAVQFPINAREIIGDKS